MSEINLPLLPREVEDTDGYLEQGTYKSLGSFGSTVGRLRSSRAPNHRRSPCCAPVQCQI